jgi:hypothetical protein
MSALTELYQEISVCKKCDIAAGRTRVVPGEGAEDAPIMFIGEAPGWHEDQRIDARSKWSYFKTESNHHATVLNIISAHSPCAAQPAHRACSQLFPAVAVQCLPTKSTFR